MTMPDRTAGPVGTVALMPVAVTIAVCPMCAPKHHEMISNVHNAPRIAATGTASRQAQPSQREGQGFESP